LRLVSLQVFPELSVSSDTRAGTVTRVRSVDRLERLDLAAQFRDAGLDKHQFRVVDVRPDGVELTVGSRAAAARPEDALLTVLIGLEPLLREGVHRLYLEVDGTRLADGVQVTVR
jgi:hypothetical protein